MRLGSIIDFSKSSSVKPNEIAPDAWILDLEDIEKDSGVLLAKKRMKDIQSKSDKHIFYSGNVLYSKLRPYLNKVIIADEKGYCTSEILAFDFGMILNKYAQIYLMSPYFVDYAMSDAYGVKMPRLGSKQGNNALMPLPPFKEQVRIAEQLAKIAPIVNRYASSQSELDRLNAELFEKLKKSVLHEAIQGKLVPQSPDDEPASVLLERIKAEKAKLFKDGKLKKKDLVDSVIFKCEDNKYYERLGKSIIEIDEHIPFNIPESWEWTALDFVSYSVGSRANQVQSKEILKEGYYPVVSQGLSLVDGYVNDGSKIIKDLPVILFGDHTRNVKYIDFPFVIGADGTKLHKAIGIYPQYLFLWMLYAANTLRDRGYARHYSLLRKTYIPLPPYKEQIRIVKKYDTALASIMSR